jgi:metal-responsive CopG/Arc/MetJ family transcriptional regulator
MGMAYDDDFEEPVYSKTVHVTITLPTKIVSRIDSRRGDTSRSRYISRILEEKLYRR